MLVSRHASALALLTYLLLAVSLLGHTWFGGAPSRRLVGGGGDPLGFVWFLAWFPYAIEHGHSPAFTTFLMAPRGANLMNSTSIFLPALTLWPVTATFGPVTSYDVLATLAVSFSAWAAYLALRRIAHHRSSAFLGGAIYGFGGYMAGQATAHANLLIVVFPPVVAMLIDDVRRGRSPVKVGLLLGLCAAAQVFVNEEILATTAIMVLIVVGFAACTSFPTRTTMMRYARMTVVAVCAFAIVAGPALLYQLLGPQHVHGLLVSPGKYVNDIAGFFTPSPVQLLSSAGSHSVTGRLSGYDGEHGSYLGVPLLALLAWAGWRLRGRALLPGVVLLAAAILSLGPHLHVLGHDTGIWLPWIVPDHLPLLENVVPDRFSLYIWLAIAALVVLLIDDLRRRPPLGHGYVGYAILGIALLPLLPNLTPSEVVRAPPVLGSASALHRVAPGAKTVLITPFTNGQFSMYAQAESGFAFDIPDGGVFVPEPGGPSYGMRQGPLLYALAALGGRASTLAGRTHADAACLEGLARRNPVEGACRSLYLSALRALRIDVVIVTNRGGGASVSRYTRFFTSLLGVPVQTRDAVVFSAWAA
jgi:hypothetical protein